MTFFRWLKSQRFQPEIKPFADWAIDNSKEITVLAESVQGFVMYEGFPLFARTRADARSYVKEVAPHMLKDFKIAADKYATLNDEWFEPDITYSTPIEFVNDFSTEGDTSDDANTIRKQIELWDEVSGWKTNE
jgi:hypothetical protein